MNTIDKKGIEVDLLPFGEIEQPDRNVRLTDSTITLAEKVEKLIFSEELKVMKSVFRMYIFHIFSINLYSKTIDTQ